MRGKKGPLLAVWGDIPHLKGTAYGIRTRVTSVRGWRPEPLDERGGLTAAANNSMY